MEATKTDKKEDCKHYWKIDVENQGICRKCGEKKDFRELQNQWKEVTRGGFYSRYNKSGVPE